MEETKVTITLDEYKDLLRTAEQVTAVNRLVQTSNYYPASDLLRLLDIEPCKVAVVE